MAKTPHFHGKDLRKGRVSISGQPYLITTVTRRRERLFLDYRLARMVIKAMELQAEAGMVESLAYVLMPDHLHWLISLQEGSDLCRIMRVVKGFSAHQVAAALRGRYAAPTGDGAITGGSGIHHANSLADGRTCSIWQPGFHDHALRKEEDLVDVARYLVMNPVRAGLVSSIWRYPFWDAIWVNGS